MRVVVSDEAKAELQSIFEYIAADSLRRTVAVVDRLDAAISDLSHSALSYPLFPERATGGVRRRIVRPYLVFYRVGDGIVEILHVVHGARDLRQIVGEDD
jgi:toxin ParE1/3/4